MAKSIISQGKTTNEAIEKGLKELKVSREMVDIKVIEETEKRSFYSILTPRVVKVELTLKEEKVKEKNKKNYNNNVQEIEEASRKIESFLKSILSDEISCEIEIKEYNIFVKLNGKDIGYLIGYRGENINALQTIVTAIANKNVQDKIRVFVDIAGYKEKREKNLEELAEKIAKTVIRTGKPITLEPMTAYERKIIHSKLQANNKVKTFSKGEEPYRKVVVSLV